MRSLDFGLLLVLAAGAAGCAGQPQQARLEPSACPKKLADAEQQTARRDFLGASDRYIALYRHKECMPADEALHRSAINLEAANELGRAIKVRRTLIAETPRSPFALPSLS